MNNYYGYIIPECFIDTKLTQFLLDNRVNHQHSCNNVVRVMRNKFNDDFAVGIIDNDKHGVSYLQEFQLIGRTSHLSFYNHTRVKHYIITVDPAMDKFIMDCAVDTEHPLSEFGLPTTLKEFTRLTKNDKILYDTRVSQLLSAIQGHNEIVKLKSVLCYLLKAHYSATIEGIRDLLQ